MMMVGHENIQFQYVRCYRLQFWLRHTQLDNTLLMADMMF